MALLSGMANSVGSSVAATAQPHQPRQHSHDPRGTSVPLHDRIHSLWCSPQGCQPVDFFGGNIARDGLDPMASVRTNPVGSESRSSIASIDSRPTTIRDRVGFEKPEIVAGGLVGPRSGSHGLRPHPVNHEPSLAIDQPAVPVGAPKRIEKPALPLRR